MENIITNKQITQMVNEEMSEDDFFDQIDSWNEKTRPFSLQRAKALKSHEPPRA